MMVVMVIVVVMVMVVTDWYSVLCLSHPLLFSFLLFSSLLLSMQGIIFYDSSRHHTPSPSSVSPSLPPTSPCPCNSPSPSPSVSAVSRRWVLSPLCPPSSTPLHLPSLSYLILTFWGQFVLWTHTEYSNQLHSNWSKRIGEVKRRVNLSVVVRDGSSRVRVRLIGFK